MYSVSIINRWVLKLVFLVCYILDVIIILNTFDFIVLGGPSIFMLVTQHGYSGSKSCSWSARSVYMMYIKEHKRKSSIISYGRLCFCATIQPPQVSVVMNSTWAGVKPLLGSSAHIWEHCHLHRLPWQLGLWWVSFGWSPFYWGQFISDMR